MDAARMRNHSEETFMFCDGCGGTVQPGQAYCSKCGKPIVGPVVAGALRRNRVESHLHLLAILWYAISALNGLAGVLVVVLANTLIPHLRALGAPPEMPVEFFVVLCNTFGILILAKAAAGFIAGWGLLRHEPWARVVTLVLAFLALLNFPLGTALGIYTLWALLPGQSQHEYEALVARAA